MSDETRDTPPATDAEETPNASQKAKTNVPPEKAAEMIQAFGELVKGMAQAKERGEIETPTIKLKPGEGGKLPEAMLNLFSAAIQQAQANQQGQAASAPAVVAIIKDVSLADCLHDETRSGRRRFLSMRPLLPTRPVNTEQTERRVGS